MLDELEKHYTTDEFAQIEGDYLRTGVLPAEVLTAASSCTAVDSAEAAVPTLPQITLDAPVTTTIDVAANRRKQVSDQLIGHYTLKPVQAATKDVFSLEALCIPMTVTNVGTYDGTFIALTTLSVVRPSGQIAYAQPDPDSADSSMVSLAPGGAASLTSCFDTNNERGQFTLRYSPLNESETSWTYTL
jgi:hypothetical protein